LHAAKRLGYIDERTYKSLDDLTRMVAAPLNGLIKRNRTLLKVAAPVIGIFLVCVSKLA